MTPWIAAAAVLLTTSVAAAQDPAAPDLTALEARALAALGEGYIARAEPARLILTCPACAGAPMAEIRLGRQEDGTEGRLRSGATTIASLDQQCRARNPSCRVERANAGPAVGWLSSYRLGEIAGNTLVLLRDGDMVVIRAVSADQEVSRRSLDLLRAEVVPAILAR